jgi:hypothetical protein
MVLIHRILYIYLAFWLVIIMLANILVGLKLSNACIACPKETAITPGIVMTFHRMACDFASTVPILKRQAVYYWPKTNLGYNCVSRPSLAVGESLTNNNTKSIISVLNDGFLD